MTDPRGGAVPNAAVSLIEGDTGLARTAITGSRGSFSFTALPVGKYDLAVDAPGFEHFERTGIVLDVNSALDEDVRLVIGAIRQSVTVSDLAAHVETSDTQLGEVIPEQKLEAIPLNGRSFTDLLALQPGVAPVSTINANSITAAGASVLSPSGDLNPGTISMNGQREYSNGFSVNGTDSVERFTMGAAIIPNLDSIQEFRVLTSNYDAETGNYSGGQVTVVTKGGSNEFHGSGFEFVRNTQLDARNYFSPDRAVYQQNQYGGTIGGPIKHDTVFFFADIQATAMKEGVDSGLISVPSAAEHNGDFSANPSVFFQTNPATGAQIPNVVNGSYWASSLSQRLGYTVQPNEPYYLNGCVSTAQCVFPNARIPHSVWSAPAQALLGYIPEPNVAGGFFSTSAKDEILRDDKGSFRIDANTRIGRISAYYFADDYSLDNPYPIEQGGASVPGFDALNLGRAQLFTLSDTQTFGPHSVNEAHFSYVRAANNVGQPSGGVGPTLASQGFLTPGGQPSIYPNRASYQGVENLIFNSYSVGLPITNLRQVDNTFEYLETFSHVSGAHTWKAGGELLANQVNALPDVQSNGTFSFFGSETGSDFADFLLGIASRYTQGDAQAFYNRNRYGALFAQDSWRANPRLTLNYGLRWDVIMPWYEKYNQIQTLVPGEQSVVYPGAPEGLVFPGDPGIARGLAPTRWNNFSPRLGIAYAPGEHDGWLGKLLGPAGMSSVRLGFGRFFSAIEGVTAGVMVGDAPYGSTYTSPAPPLFTDPFISAANGYDNGQRFPLTYPALNASASHPDNTVNWANFLPITGLPGYYPGNKTPYNEQYTLSIQRQFGPNLVATATYVGSEAHHLLVLLEANPGNPALCLSLSDPSQVSPGSPTCGPFSESSSFVRADGSVVPTTRAPFGPNFGSVTWLSSFGNSNFNALETTLRYSANRLELLAGYTYGKSLDNASSISEEVNPFDYRQTYAPSAFDVKHNFVVSYRWQLPFDRLRYANRLTSGWALSGATRFSTGLPVTLYNSSDNSLLGSQPNGVNATGVDLPEVTSGPLNLNSNPRNGQPYFNTSLFSLQPLGQPGNAARRMFYGPGMANYDMALTKVTSITERTSLQIRMEAFNVLNHAQFFGASSVGGEITDPGSFGQILSAMPPRLMQVAAKLTF